MEVEARTKGRKGAEALGHAALRFIGAKGGNGIGGYVPCRKD
jgi:hypothetical protein